MLHPPFCPHPACPLHVKPGSDDARRLRGKDWYTHAGVYHTKVRGEVQRFKCRVCGKGFSEQTFRLDYYVSGSISGTTT